MVFCGKCGFQLTSGNITCPRCGTPTETEINLEESQPDSPTIASSTILGINQSYPGTQATIGPSGYIEQQPLILGSHSTDYSTVEQRAHEATSTMSSHIDGTAQVPNGSAYPDYKPQSEVNYPQQRTSYPGYTFQGGATSQQFGTSLEDVEKVKARGRIVGLLLILIGLLFILGAMVLFILTHNSSATIPSPIQQAHSALTLIFTPIFL